MKSSRREFLKRTGVGAVSLGILDAELLHAAEQAPRDIPQVYAPRPLKPSALTMDGISKRTMEEHYKLYVGYVNKSNEILDALKTVDYAKANQTYSSLRVLKVELTFAVGGVKNHEIYFDHLGGKGGRPEGRILGHIARDFGSYEAWEKDLKATGLAARGWVWLAYDADRGRLFNYLGDAQNTFPVWNAIPLLALDTYEHAYFLDYATDRKSYIEAFMRNLDWSAVEQRFAQIPHLK
ncbi:MAG: superoxide dismutase [Ignavibacteria bacterium]|nr:superoxide dismutase [Ignavibacteria bacterium]